MKAGGAVVDLEGAEAISGVGACAIGDVRRRSRNVCRVGVDNNRKVLDWANDIAKAVYGS